MRSHFQRKPVFLYLTERLLQRSVGAPHAPFLYHFPVPVQDAVTACSVPQIYSNGERTFPGLLFLLRTLPAGAAILLHGRRSFALRVRIPIGSLTASPRERRPSHPICRRVSSSMQ